MSAACSLFLKWRIGTALSLLLIVWGTLTRALSGVKVIISNDTEAPVRDIHIIYWRSKVSPTNCTWAYSIGQSQSCG
jgi:hypothetical protein